MSPSARAAITKHHRLGGLNSRHLFLPALEAGKLQIKAPVDSVCGESLPASWLVHGLPSRYVLPGLSLGCALDVEPVF